MEEFQFGCEDYLALKEAELEHWMELADPADAAVRAMDQIPLEGPFTLPEEALLVRRSQEWQDWDSGRGRQGCDD